MSSSHDPKKNPLLAALRAGDYARLLPDLELTPMPLGWTVYEAGVPWIRVFPTTCIISLLYVMENGDSRRSQSSATTVWSVSVFMGGDSVSSRAVVQNAGDCYRIKAKLLKKNSNWAAACKAGATLHADAHCADVQTGACNRHHTLESSYAAGCC